MPRPLDPELTRKCPQCKTIFQTTRQRLKQAKLTGKSFCSNACAAKYHSKRKINLPPVKKTRPENIVVGKCGFCGKHVSKKRRKDRGKLGLFCSHVCYGKWRSENLSGTNSPNWKGGYSLDYGGSNWKSQRAKARKRDKNVCQDCGVTEQAWGYQLDVHHIFPYDTFDDPKEANQLKNLVTLCRDCHAARHKEPFPL